jgi:hypothetical protein
MVETDDYRLRRGERVPKERLDIIRPARLHNDETGVASGRKMHCMGREQHISVPASGSRGQIDQPIIEDGHDPPATNPYPVGYRKPARNPRRDDHLVRAAPHAPARRTRVAADDHHQLPSRGEPQEDLCYRALEPPRVYRLKSRHPHTTTSATGRSGIASA